VGTGVGGGLALVSEFVVSEFLLSFKGLLGTSGMMTCHSDNPETMSKKLFSVCPPKIMLLTLFKAFIFSK
jgi:hypothetical protein